MQDEQIKEQETKLFKRALIMHSRQIKEGGDSKKGGGFSKTVL